nr:toxin-antitoxin system HicB family antitoxin [Paenibacillus sp. OK003]
MGEDKYSGKFNLRVPRSLHRQLVERAAAEDVSLNQYCLYKLSR